MVRETLPKGTEGDASRPGSWPAFAVHLFTAGGAALALLAMLAAGERRWTAMFALLGVALVVDGVDGAVARRLDIGRRLPRWSGEVLDLVVDILTYVFVPAYAIAASSLLPPALATPVAVLIVVTGALYFADRRMKTADNHFRGFPAVWNVVAFYLFLLQPPPWLAAAGILALAAATFVPIPFVHPFRVRRGRRLNLALTALWGVLAVASLASGLAPEAFVTQGLCALALYFLLAGLWRCSSVVKDERARHEGRGRMAGTAVVLITGGGRGIGAATARIAAAHGFDVAVNYKSNAEAAGEVVSAVEAAGRRAIAVQGDMAKEEDVRRVFAAVDDAFGRLDHLVYSSGVTGPTSRVEALGTEAMREVLDVNLLGAFLAAREAIPRLSRKREGQGGSIVLLSSVAAVLGSANEYVVYAASKGAIDSMTVGLSRELAADGIRVNAVAPGLIETDIHAPGRLERLAPMVPMGRAGTAEEVAEAIVFLLSDAASYVSGTILRVTGGR